RANQTVHVAAVITLLLQRGLHISNYLVGRQVIVCIDRSIPRIIRIGIIAPGGEPVTRVPIIRCAEHEHNVIMIMAAPPILVVPLCLVTAKHSILLSLPVFASFNVSALLELHSWRFRGVWLFGKIEVLRFKWLSCRHTSFPRFATCWKVRFCRLAGNLGLFLSFTFTCAFCFLQLCGLIGISDLSLALCLAVFSRLVHLRRVSATLCLPIFRCSRWWSSSPGRLGFTYWLSMWLRNLPGRSALFLTLFFLFWRRLRTCDTRKRKTTN